MIPISLFIQFFFDVFPNHFQSRKQLYNRKCLSVCLFVRLKAKPFNSLKSAFIIHPSSFILHPLSFIISIISIISIIFIVLIIIIIDNIMTKHFSPLEPRTLTAVLTISPTVKDCLPRGIMSTIRKVLQQKH